MTERNRLIRRLVLSVAIIPCFGFSVISGGCSPLTASSQGTRSLGSPAADSLSAWIHQMLLVGFRGTTLSDAPWLQEAIHANGLGGVILFDYDLASRSYGRNISSPEQVRALLKSLDSLAAASGHPILFKAIDQEGGKVTRLKPRYGFPDQPSAMRLARLPTLDSVSYYASKTATLLRTLGFNVNFAPVVDLAINPKGPAIAALERSYGASPEAVSRYAGEVIIAHLDGALLPVLKHFPGHGSATADSHLGLTDVTEVWSKLELQPFETLLKTYPRSAVMTAHLFNRTLDGRYPATLSKRVINKILREEWGFDGVIFSDDMQMKAIASEYGFETAIEMAIHAGVDVLVFGNNLDYDPDIITKAAHHIRFLVTKGILSEERIKASYRRIQAAKARLIVPGNMD